MACLTHKDLRNKLNRKFSVLNAEKKNRNYLIADEATKSNDEDFTSTADPPLIVLSDSVSEDEGQNYDNHNNHFLDEPRRDSQTCELQDFNSYKTLEFSYNHISEKLHNENEPGMGVNLNINTENVHQQKYQSNLMSVALHATDTSDTKNASKEFVTASTSCTSKHIKHSKFRKHKTLGKTNNIILESSAEDIIEISSEEDVTTSVGELNKKKQIIKPSNKSSSHNMHILRKKDKKINRHKRVTKKQKEPIIYRLDRNNLHRKVSSADQQLTIVDSSSKMHSSGHYEVYDSFEEEDGDEVNLIKSGLKQYSFFSENDCSILEQMIDDQVVERTETFKHCTVDRAPLRNKYFFGEGYTYGTQMKKKGPGMEELYPNGYVDEIPEWVVKLVIQPLEKAGIIPKNFINSCVINDYLKGGCIISHIDPKHLFDRPIFTISLMSDSALSFGVKFSFKPIRCSRPTYRLPLKRGRITAMR